MKYERFEELPVWNVAIDLAQHIYHFARNRFFVNMGDLSDQLRRAALCVSNSIAEGFERASAPELLVSLNTARGAVGEVRSMLHLVDRSTDAGHLEAELALLKSQCEACSHQIGLWIERLQNAENGNEQAAADKRGAQKQFGKRANDYQWQLAEVVRRRREEKEQKAAEKDGSAKKEQDPPSRKL